MNQLFYRLENFKIKMFFETEFLSGHEQIPVSDTLFLEFLKLNHDGFFFSKALHIYGLSNLSFHNIFKVNKVFAEEYQSILKSPGFCFATDVFGNQFCFNNQGTVSFLNIETAEEELIANSFEEWIERILAETNYFSGESLLLQWEEVMGPLNFNERLVPKRPFIINGAYACENLRIDDWENCLRYNASIARQIHDLPDGTMIEFRVD
jgi:hypothetical protein